MKKLVNKEKKEKKNIRKKMNVQKNPKIMYRECMCELIIVV